jgi:hypothetical protein
MTKIQIIRCKCGKPFAACREPECYTEKEWMKDLRKYVQEGCTVEMIDSGVGNLSLEKCVCVKAEKNINPNQIELFNEK